MTYTVILHVHVEAESSEEAQRIATAPFPSDMDVSIEGCDEVEDTWTNCPECKVMREALAS